jgi:ectoine hydroxylase-related dioxygenase (phytanoyl-CoA dioxygenase family)
MSPEEHAANIERDGFTILEDAIDTAAADAVVRDLERLERELSIEPAKNIFEGSKTHRVYNLLAHGPLYQGLVEHAGVLAIVERVLDRGCLLSTISSIAIGPGETAQPLHGDDQQIPLPRPHQALRVTTMWALTDFTEENGATRIVAGSHKSPDFPAPFGVHETTPVLMRRGSVLLYNGELWHGGGANRTNERRVGVAIGYCAGWIRQQENQQLGVPRELAKTFSPRLRKLCGYGIYRGQYGHIDKCSPVDLLDETGPRRVVGEPR